MKMVKNSTIAKTTMAIAISLVSASAFAANLMQVYNQALKSDPTFKQAKATWLAAKQNLPIAEANLLPTITLTGSVNRNYAFAKQSPTNGYFNSTAYGVTIDEPLFNMANWAGIRSASAGVKAATATYMAAAQDLMQRTAKAYFAVLQAADQLHFTITQKNSVWQQLETSRQKYKVGLIAITPVYDAQASYDTAVANEITDHNALDNAIENLRAITGHEYKTLQGLGGQVPLFIPMPKNINNWVSIAIKQNYALQSQLYQVQADKELVSQSAAARYPTLDATGSYNVNNYGNFGQVQRPNTTGGAIGLSLNFPIYQGGAIGATTKQNEYNYLNSSATLEFQHRNVVNQTRQAYLGVVAGISGIKADKQSVVSNENSLQATKAGYVVGTRTMVDVLQSLTQLTNAQKAYSQDQYNYIDSLISLKQQAGTLSVKDMEQINSWLKSKKRLIRNRFNNSYTPTTPTTPVISTKKKVKSTHKHKMRTHKKLTLHSGYGVQVFASLSKSQAQNFMKTHALSNGYIVKANVAGQTWYKVISGDYKSFKQAHTAMNQLPQSLQGQSPWITKLS